MKSSQFIPLGFTCEIVLRILRVKNVSWLEVVSSPLQDLREVVTWSNVEYAFLNIS